jgi:hypothetical protein
MISTGLYLYGSESNHYCSGGVVPASAQPGTVWWDSNTSKLVVYSGSFWQPMDTQTHIMLTPEAERAIDWVRERMREEERVKQMADKYPMVSAALHELATVLKLHENLDNDQ